MEYFDSITIYALLNGTWTALDVLARDSISARWGMFNTSRISLLADIGEMRFTLKNINGQYYPDGSSPLSGWGSNVKTKIVFVYNGVPCIRFLGTIPSDGVGLRVGKVANEDYVTVNVQDWVKHATETPIKSPVLEEDIEADTAIETLMTYLPSTYRISMDLDTGNETFPTVFDGTGLETTFYSEAARLVYSESPGRIYVTKPRTSGQLLVFENSTARDSPTQKSTYTITLNKWLNHSADDNWKNHAGGTFWNHSPTLSGAALVTFNSDIDSANIDYGSNIINYAVVQANPKRTDDEVRVLYRLPRPVAIANGETITIKGRYVDPGGGGTKINAIVSSMQTPEIPGGTDPYMMLLCHFTTDTSDSTGRHSVTANDVTIEDDVYIDVGPEPDVQRINGNILGPYALFGGYADYNLSVASSNDFEFGAGAFTIGCYANILDPASGDCILARDGTTTYAPWVFGKSDGTNLLLYASSNGSSWDIANGRSFGQIQRGRWVHYEWGRDDYGWFYMFTDGELVDTWYNTSSFVFSVGKAQGSNYIFMGFDELYIKKGQCLHTANFTPPQRNLSHTLEGDYLCNTSETGNGTDLSSGLTVSPSYDPSEVTYTLTNESGSAGYIIHLQARGRGLYNYDPITKIVQDADSITANNYQRINIDQYYQQDLEAGTTWITAIVSEEKDARTVLRGISFVANNTAANMLRFLQCDVGDLVRIVLSNPGIDGYYHIQSVGFEVYKKELVKCTWGVVEGNTP